MKISVRLWPAPGRHIHICCFVFVALASLIFAVAHPAKAGEALPAPMLVRLHGQVIEQWCVCPVVSQGTVVFENGSRAELEGWTGVISALDSQSSQPAPEPAKAWSLFAYDRPGVGRSEPTDRPRDGRQIVADLRELLQQQDLKPPYLLVGHSLGGLYMQLFARLYPGEVQGLVLVDALYPGVIKRPEDFPFYTRWGKALFLNRMAAREIDAIYATGEDVLATPWSPDIPVIRLVNVPKSAGAIAVDFGVINTDAATIAVVRALYPGAKTVVVDSDHQIQKANPEVVVQAIQEVMAAH